MIGSARRAGGARVGVRVRRRRVSAAQVGAAPSCARHSAHGTHAAAHRLCSSRTPVRVRVAQWRRRVGRGAGSRTQEGERRGGRMRGCSRRGERAAARRLPSPRREGGRAIVFRVAPCGGGEHGGEGGQRALRREGRGTYDSGFVLVKTTLDRGGREAPTPPEPQARWGRVRVFQGGGRTDSQRRSAD